MGEGKLTDFEKVILSDFGSDHIGWMKSKPFTILACSAAMEKLRPSFNKFALDFHNTYTSKGARVRVNDALASLAQNLFGEVVHEKFLSSRIASQSRDEVLIGGHGGEGSPIACKSPQMIDTLQTQFWAAPSQYEVQATEKCFFGSLRLAFTGSRVVAAAHLPTVIAFLSSEKVQNQNEGEGAGQQKDMFVASLGDVPKITMADCKAWLRNLTQDMLNINI